MRRLLGGLVVLISGVLVLGASAGGDEEKKEKFNKYTEFMFKKLDANEDGKVSRAELLKWADKAPEDKAEKFRTVLNKVYDKVSDGSDGLTLEQFRKAAMTLRELKMKKKDDN